MKAFENYMHSQAFFGHHMNVKTDHKIAESAFSWFEEDHIMHVWIYSKSSFPALCFCRESIFFPCSSQIIGTLCFSQVSAYGYITEDYQKYSDHYYDKQWKRLIFYLNHDFDLERRVWKKLHDANIMKLYQRSWPRDKKDVTLTTGFYCYLI